MKPKTRYQKMLAEAARLRMRVKRLYAGGHKQIDIARKLGITRQYVSMIINGRTE